MKTHTTVLEKHGSIAEVTRGCRITRHIRFFPQIFSSYINIKPYVQFDFIFDAASSRVEAPTHNFSRVQINVTGTYYPNFGR